MPINPPVKHNFFDRTCDLENVENWTWNFPGIYLNFSSGVLIFIVPLLFCNNTNRNKDWQPGSISFEKDVSITFKRLLNGKNISTVPANGNRKKQPDRFIYFRDHSTGVVPAMEDHLYIKERITDYFAASATYHLVKPGGLPICRNAPPLLFLSFAAHIILAEAWN